MDLSQIKLFALMPVLLTVFGCATAPSQSNSQVATPTAATMIGDAQQGARVQLPTDNALGYSSVLVGRTYYAASGRQCRKLLSTDGAPLSRVSCRTENGAWQLARDLQPVSASMSSITSSQSMQSRNPVMQQINTSDASDIVIVESVAIDIETIDTETIDTEKADTVEERLRANETLWAFAKRTTGNALNWEAIAELNGISNTNTVAVGTSLSIPAALVDQGG